MPEQSVHEARGLVRLALKMTEHPDANVHRGLRPHLLIAQTHLDAACALLSAGRPQPELEEQ